MADEVELKFIVKDYRKIVQKILSMSKFLSSAHELTVMYDNVDKSLFQEDARLRLRRIINVENHVERCELSYKKPKTREGVKIEEEYEASVSSFDEMEIILEKIGFSKVSSYERIRDTFEKDGCKITVDSFSFGDLVEIEGKLEKIKKISQELGFNLKENTTKSCDDIYADICGEKGEEVNDHILFEKDSLSQKIQQRSFLIA